MLLFLFSINSLKNQLPRAQGGSCSISFKATFADLSALNYWPREFPLSATANRFEFWCQPGGGGHFMTESQRDLRSKNFCCDPIPESWRNFDTRSQNVDVVCDHHLPYKIMANC